MEFVLKYRRGSFQLEEIFHSFLGAIERSHYLWIRHEGDMFEVFQDKERLIGNTEIRAAWVSRKLDAARSPRVIL